MVMVCTFTRRLLLEYKFDLNSLFLFSVGVVSKGHFI